MNKSNFIFKKKITVLPDNEKINVLDDELKNNILNIRKKRIELTPGMGGVSPYLLDHLLGGGSNLVSLDIAITAGCNFKCIWCYRPGKEWGKMFLSFDKIKEIINEAIKLHVQYFIITGGEPLIYKDGDITYFDIIDYINKVCKENNISPNILTFSDVALITEEIAVKLAKRKVALCLKRDSTDNFIQNSILGVSNGSSKIVQGYKNLFDVGYGSKKDLIATVNTVLAKNISFKNDETIDTADGLIDLHIWVKQNNMEHSIVPIHYCGEAKNKDQERGINPLDIKVLYDIMSAIDEFEFNDVWKVYSPFPKNKTCNRPGRGIHVRSTGDVTSCSESPLIDDYIFGNIYETSLSDIILSNKFLNFRQDFDNREGKYICNAKVCDLFANRLCRGGCATRSAYSKIDVETGCMEQNKYEKAYHIGREDPFCPAWVVLAKKQGALTENIYEEYVDYYLSKSSLSFSLKEKIRNKIVLEFNNI